MRVWITLFVALLSLGLASCGDSASGEFNGQPVSDDFSIEAELRLFRHDIQGAHAIYTQALSDMPNNSTAAVGQAVTRLLLLPYSAHVTRIFRENFEATVVMSISDNVIYGDGGVFYLLARGVDVEDGENYPGIFSLLDGRLPWSSARLKSPTSFFGILTRSLNELADNLQPVAVELEEIQVGLKIGANDPQFRSFLLPGEVFHSDAFNIILNRTELFALDGVLSFVRSGIHFAGAYSWDVTLKALFDEDFEDMPTDDPRYVEGWMEDDYFADLVSTTLLREVRNPQRLVQAQAPLAQTFGSFRQAVHVGIDEQTNDIISWRSISRTFGEELVMLLTAFELSVTTRTVLPFISPEMSLDLSMLFDGRVLSPEINWFVHDEFEGVDFNDEAVQAIGVNGLFSPEFDIEFPPEFEFSEDSSGLSNQLVGGFQDEVRDSYL